MAEKISCSFSGQQPKIDKIRNKTNNRQTQFYQIIHLATRFDHKRLSSDWLPEHTKRSTNIALRK